MLTGKEWVHKKERCQGINHVGSTKSAPQLVIKIKIQKDLLK